MKCLLLMTKDAKTAFVLNVSVSGVIDKSLIQQVDMIPDSNLICIFLLLGLIHIFIPFGSALLDNCGILPSNKTNESIKKLKKIMFC